MRIGAAELASSDIALHLNNVTDTVQSSNQEMTVQFIRRNSSYKLNRHFLSRDPSMVYSFGQTRFVRKTGPYKGLLETVPKWFSGACPAEFLAKIVIRPVFGFVRFRVFVRRRGSRVPGRGAASAARQDKKIAGLGGFEGRRIPPQRSLSLWVISQTPRARKDAHTCRWSWTEKRAVSGVSR